MNRAELQRLANERRREARVLLKGRCWSGAYYLAGYVIECGLKACIISHLMRTDQFPERKFSEQCWTHNLAQLLSLANLKADLDAAFITDPLLASNWAVVNGWKETSRYERPGKAKAVALYEAVTDPKHGVLSWIKSRW